MKRKIVLGIIVLYGSFVTLNAETCFQATGKAFKDAQTLRKLSNNMGWELGKFTSLWAGSFIESKKNLYPEDNLEVCVKVNTNRDNLIFKVQVDTSDVGKSIW